MLLRWAWSQQKTTAEEIEPTFRTDPSLFE